MRARRTRPCGVFGPGRLLFTAVWLLACGVSWRVRAQETSPPLLMPSAIAYDAAGDLFMADRNRNQVFEATLAGTLLTVAGTGVQGSSGDGGPATAAELNRPEGLAFGADGTLYIADTGNARVRALSGGMLTTFAGSGAVGSGGDGGPAASASFRSPTALAVDAAGALLICDTADGRVRRVSNGVVTTFAGTGLQGFAGDGAAATAAELDSPMGLAAAPDGRVWIADTHNGRVRLVAADGTISTFAGTGQRGSAGDGGLAIAAQLAGPRGLAFTPAGTLLIADADGQRVRAVAANGQITTVVGSGAEGSSTDGANGLQAAMHAPRALAVSPFRQPAVSDALNGTVRVLTGTGALYQPAALAAGRSSSLLGSFAPGQAYGGVSGASAVSGPAGVAQGLVSLSESGTVVATAALSGGQVSWTLPRLRAWPHTLTVAYGGDGLNPAATASLAPFTVSPLPVTAVAASVSSEYGAPLPAFSGTLTGILPQDAASVSAAFTGSVGALPAVGSYPIGVALTGPAAGNYAVNLAADSGVLQITPAGSSVSLSTVGPGYAGVPLRLTASVAPSTSGKPGGSVQFVSGGTVVATAVVVNGSASALFSAPPLGTLELSAEYSGDGNFSASSSRVQTAVVNALPDFTVSVAGASTVSVPAGSVGTYSLNVSSLSSPFTGVVTLSAGGLPAGATVTFAPVQVVPGASVAGVTVSVQAPAAQARMRRLPGRASGVIWAFAGVCCCGLWLRRGRRRLLWLVGAGLLMCGCGARTVGEGVTATASTTYTLQLTGTSTNLVGALVTHTTPVTLAVQN